jgi:hypothetical protein
MRNLLIVLCLVVAAMGCGRSDATGGGLPNDSSGCGYAAGLDSTAPGACKVGRVQLACTLPSGGGCECVTDEMTCSGCGSDVGGVCQSKCGANEYAVSCGGPPPFDGSFTYADPPAGCHSGLGNPGGSAFYCCPCQ